MVEINGQKVYYIDSIPTLIDSVHGSYAKGRILERDLSFTPCYIAKSQNFFAHGKTLKEAVADAKEKYEENMPIEERLELFNRQYPDREKKIPARELFDWHHTLTGSCLMGRKEWCKYKGIDVENDKFTINEFIELTRDSYGGEIIKKLEQL